MKATSVQNIKNVKSICFSIENHPAEMESKLTVIASTNDDIFAFEFEGPELIQQCKAAGLFTGWEKDQKIKELKEELGRWKKEAADCLKLRDEAQKEAYKLKQENEELKYQLSDIQTTKEVVEQKLNTMDNVNHPSHYETGKFECIEVMQEVFGINAVRDFCKCNAFKYIYRMDRKNGEEDARKAIWYLNKYLELNETKED